MSRSDRLPGVLLVGALACAVAAFLVRRECAIRELDRALDTQLRRNHQAANAAFRQVRQRIEATKSAGAAPAAHPPEPTSNIDRGRMIRRELLGMPEYRRFFWQEGRRRMIRSYAAWLEQLPVSPERLDAIKQAMTEREIAQQDAYEATVAHYKSGTPEFFALTQRYWKDADEKLRAALTAEEWTAFRGYEAAKDWFTIQRHYVDDYLGERGVEPLTSEQNRVLGEAFVAARKWKPEDKSSPPAVVYRMANERIAAIAAPALKPAQLEALRGYIEFINTRSKLMGQLLNPSAPDAMVITPGDAPR